MLETHRVTGAVVDIITKRKPMPHCSTHRARITGPIAFNTGVGDTQHIPLGPCVIEGQADASVDIIWGQYGQKSASLPLEAMQSAKDQGHLVLLD
jgi:hypothetical protein